MKLKLWVCTDFEGFWPVPTAAVVLAESEAEASALLVNTLFEKGLKTTGFTLTPIDTTKAAAVILSDGDY